MGNDLPAGIRKYDRKRARQASQWTNGHHLESATEGLERQLSAETRAFGAPIMAELFRIEVNGLLADCAGAI